MEKFSYDAPVSVVNQKTFINYWESILATQRFAREDFGSLGLESLWHYDKSAWIIKGTN